MKKLNEDKLREVIRESLYVILSEEYEGNLNEFHQKCSEYKTILDNEYRKAQEDLNKCQATYHYGIRDSLQHLGYTVLNARDNSCSFFGPSKLFLFSAYQNHRGGNSWNMPWIIGHKIRIESENYNWSVQYQYGYYRKENVKEFWVEDFEKEYMRACVSSGETMILKPYKSNAENVSNYTQFTVFKDGGGLPRKTLAVYNNFEDAKVAAYRFAKKMCIEGSGSKDDTSRYYHSEPINVTNNFPGDVLVYEYYNYNEHWCIIGVEAK